MSPKAPPAVIGQPVSLSSPTMVLACEQDGANLWVTLRPWTPDGPGEPVLKLRPFHAGELYRALGRVLHDAGVRP